MTGGGVSGRWTLVAAGENVGGVLGAAPRRMGCGANEVATRGKAFPLLIKNKKSDIMKLWKVTRKNLLILWLIARF